MSGLGEWDDAPPDEPAEATSSTEADDPQPLPSEDERKPDDPPELTYPSLDAFVRDYVIKVFRRRVSDRGPYRWDAKWWESTEAQVRLDAMWRSWEHLRQDPNMGMSTWLKDVADPQMEALMDPEGPFKYSTSSNERGAPLPYEAPPSTLFGDERQRPLEGEATEGG